jgi:hypothetical protein
MEFNPLKPELYVTDFQKSLTFIKIAWDSQSNISEKIHYLHTYPIRAVKS